jgi:hypothetical protein
VCCEATRDLHASAPKCFGGLSTRESFPPQSPPPHHLPTVVPDHRGLKTVRSGGVQLTDESLLALRERIAGAMGPVDAPHQKKSSTPTLKETYQANKHVGLAFDNALARCFNEESLRLFLPLCAPAALQPGWVRYRTEVASMPEAVACLSPGRKFRSCIYNESTGESKLECVFGETRRSFFVISIVGPSALAS